MLARSIESRRSDAGAFENALLPRDRDVLAACSSIRKRYQRLPALILLTGRFRAYVTGATGQQRIMSGVLLQP